VGRRRLGPGPSRRPDHLVRTGRPRLSAAHAPLFPPGITDHPGASRSPSRRCSGGLPEDDRTFVTFPCDKWPRDVSSRR
jgi:hypothetical protein